MIILNFMLKLFGDIHKSDNWGLGDLVEPCVSLSPQLAQKNNKHS